MDAVTASGIGSIITLVTIIKRTMRSFRRNRLLWMIAMSVALQIAAIGLIVRTGNPIVIVALVAISTLINFYTVMIGVSAARRR